jgi:hypothetical protein
VQNNLRIQQQGDAGIAGSMMSGTGTQSSAGGTGGMGETGLARRRSTSSSTT